MKKSSLPSPSRSPIRTTSVGRIAKKSCHFDELLGAPFRSTNRVPSEGATYTSPKAVGLSVAKVTMSALPSPVRSATAGRSKVDTAKKLCQRVGGPNDVPFESAT